MENTRYEIDTSWEVLLRYFGIGYKKRSTGVLVFLSPFTNENTPSCHAWPKSGRYHCFSSQSDGDKIDFCMKISNLRTEHDLLGNGIPGFKIVPRFPDLLSAGSSPYFTDPNQLLLDFYG